MLKVIEKHAGELAKLDPSFSQIAQDMPSFEKRAVEATSEYAPIHPGLARYLREKGAWAKKWDSKVAAM
jgi:TRAP-type uncharacterized transport system substrate-binding protein